MSNDTGIQGRVAVLGAGREGLAAYKHLQGLPAIESINVITEKSTGHENETQLSNLGVLKICPLAEAGLEDYDWLVRSPGISCYRQSLQCAEDAGTQITTPSSIWFAENPDANTVVITGTKGKSTTSALLAHLLNAAGYRTQLAGNIGTPLLACEMRNLDWWVIELSSYQLADLVAQPTYGAVLNLATDHLDWHGSVERYHADKLRLADLLEPGHLFANGSDPVLRKLLSDHKHVHWFDIETSEAADIKMPESLPGQHNRSNLAACLALMKQMGLDLSKSTRGLASFEGLPHRLNRIGIINGIEYVDDSISTAPVSTIAALEAFSDRPVVLLVGGYERGIDWSPYVESFRHCTPQAVVALPDNGPRIVAALEKGGINPELGSVCSQGMEHALELARQMAPSNAVILLSPGAPSFPHFRDYEDRGKQFAERCLKSGKRT